MSGGSNSVVASYGNKIFIQSSPQFALPTITNGQLIIQVKGNPQAWMDWASKVGRIVQGGGFVFVARGSYVPSVAFGFGWAALKHVFKRTSQGDWNIGSKICSFVIKDRPLAKVPVVFAGVALSSIGARWVAPAPTKFVVDCVALGQGWSDGKELFSQGWKGLKFILERSKEEVGQPPKPIVEEIGKKQVEKPEFGGPDWLNDPRAARWIVKGETSARSPIENNSSYKVYEFKDGNWTLRNDHEISYPVIEHQSTPVIEPQSTILVDGILYRLKDTESRIDIDSFSGGMEGRPLRAITMGGEQLLQHQGQWYESYDQKVNLGMSFTLV